MTRLPVKFPAPVKLSFGLTLAIVGGLAQASAWPRLDWWPFTFLCLIPLWRAIMGQTAKRAFLFGWVYGLALGLSSFYWLSSVMSGYGGLGPVGGFLVLLILAAYLAVYNGLWATLMARYTLKEPMMDARLLAVPLLGATLWTGFDFLKNLVFTGFNWTPLAGGLSGRLEFIGAADLIGIYGLTLVVCFIGLLLASVANVKHQLKAVLWQVLVSAILMICLFSYGKNQLDSYDNLERTSEKSTVAVLQPSISQERKWNPLFRREILLRYENLLKKAQSFDPIFIIWPETAAPFIYGIDQIETKWLDDLGQSVGVPMLVGTAAGEWDQEGDLRLYNRAWLVDGADGRNARYDKSHLVPFGEYVPFSDVLPFMKWPFVQGIFGASGIYSFGTHKEPLTVRNIPFGVLICFESIFPYQARQRALSGVRFLVVTTNDAWFGESFAPDQHLSQSVMRAIETRKPLIRVGNNGISALISSSGRIVSSSKLNDINAYAYELPLTTSEKETFFVRYGYFLAPFATIITVCCVLYRLSTWLKSRPKKEKSNKAKKGRR
ncbi:MAG: apolipoprotein N-acyltransferase [Deltaproteobacteria bacterium]|jgi:apolipoprotein N-acyltransferase|nr:apolipoprotein N-acyltransferase [Deltaproteobacteria bacterium]